LIQHDVTAAFSIGSELISKRSVLAKRRAGDLCAFVVRKKTLTASVIAMRCVAVGSAIEAGAGSVTGFPSHEPACSQVAATALASAIPNAHYSVA